MRKHSIRVIQLVAAVLSAFLLLCLPFPYLWLNVTVYILIMASMIFIVSGINMKHLEETRKTVEKLKSELNRFNHEVQVASSQISSVSEQLNVTLDENNAFAQQLYAETKEMAEHNSIANENIHSTLSGVKNIIDMLEDAGNTISEMEMTSRTSEEVIKSSLDEILNIVNIINEIQQSSNGTIEYMDKLNKTSGEIIHILETVSNVSKQTQLLALNAAIESARAGEYGKGFGVVADEIGKLAVDTGTAVKDVNMLISSIQNEISSVFDVVQMNSAKVEMGVKVSKSIEENLGKIDTTFEKVLHMVQKINSLSKKEVDLTKDIGSRIEAVESIMHEAEKSVEDVKESVHKQKHGVEDIAEMGGRLNQASKSLSLLFEGNDMITEGKEEKKASENAVASFKSICRNLKSNKEFVSLNKTVHRELLDKLIKDNEFIEAAWTNDIKGRFVCSIPDAGIANAGVREWFKQSIKGEEYISSVYISAITRNPCITISAPIRDESESIVGVFGIDVKL